VTRYSNIIVLTALSMGLTACSYFSGSSNNAYDTNKAYKTGYNGTSNVTMPSDLNSSKIQNNYAVSPNASNSAQDPSLMPPGSQVQAPAPQQQQTLAQGQTAAQDPAAVAASTRKSPVVGNQVTVNKNLKQTWAETGKALSSSGYSIVEQDASLSTYYVADKVGTGGSIKRDTPIYQVQLQSGNQGTVILLMNSHNQPADSQTSNRILGTLRDKL
jgi:uncharacterized lipoprotein